MITLEAQLLIAPNVLISAAGAASTMRLGNANFGELS
jgi:hypothetical protein